jgi:hypothetical protein
MSEVRKQLGLRGETYGPTQTASGYIRLPSAPELGAIQVKLLPSNVGQREIAGRLKRRSAFTHRLVACCWLCYKWIPVGRLQQHAGTVTCLKSRISTVKKEIKKLEK